MKSQANGGPPSGTRTVLVLHTGGTIGGLVNSTQSDAANESPSGNLKERIKKLPEFRSFASATESWTTTTDPFGVMQIPAGLRRTSFALQELKPLVDSSDMTIEHWELIARTLESAYDSFDGFVVTHGTNTMAYTAAALSFMMQGLGKPVVLTGAQVPMFQPGSDGPRNLRGAILLAGSLALKEVAIYFNGRLMRGNRATKVSFSDIDGFKSPGVEALAVLEDEDLGVSLSINYKEMNRCRNVGDDDNVNLCVKIIRKKSVAVITLTPTMTSEQLQRLLSAPTEGAVIVCFGALNLPLGRQDIVAALQSRASEIPLLVVSPCHERDSESARTLELARRHLSEVGVVSGGDMTLEAAVAKMSFVLGSSLSLSLGEKNILLEKSIAGERT